MDAEVRRRPGRPRKITREAIAAAGRRLTLPKVTVADVAAELGVGVRSLYKHTSGIADIQVITAEEIFACWEAPAPTAPLADHLLEVALSLRELALTNPGIAGFLVRASSAVSSRVVQVMDAHQQSVARAYDLPLAQASVLLAAVAEHALSVTDVVHSHGGRDRDHARMAQRDDLPAMSAAAREHSERDDEAAFRFTMAALVTGLLQAVASDRTA